MRLSTPSVSMLLAVSVFAPHAHAPHRSSLPPFLGWPAIENGKSSAAAPAGSTRLTTQSDTLRTLEGNGKRAAAPAAIKRHNAHAETSIRIRLSRDRCGSVSSIGHRNSAEWGNIAAGSGAGGRLGIVRRRGIFVKNSL